MISIVHLTKKFNEFTAVDDLNLQIEPGEFFGFLGPNGAGKTTTIKMITGLFLPTSGSISINGYDIEKEPLKAKLSTGYVPDQPFLYEKLTGREFLFFSAGLYRMSNIDTKLNIKKLTELFEIDAWIDRRTEHYSQGMKQRIVICAAMLHNPRVLVIDEPMVGLDPRSAHIIKETLKMKVKEGVSVFMSTHSLTVAEELCHRVAIIKSGRLIFNNTIDVLHEFKQKYDGKFESMFLELTK